MYCEKMKKNEIADSRWYSGRQCIARKVDFPGYSMRRHLMQRGTMKAAKSSLLIQDECTRLSEIIVI